MTGYRSSETKDVRIILLSSCLSLDIFPLMKCFYAIEYITEEA